MSSSYSPTLPRAVPLLVEELAVTQWFMAIDANDISTMESIYDEYKDNILSTMNRNGDKSLRAAVKRGNIDVIKFLLKIGASPTNQNQLLQNTALMTAAWLGHTTIVELILNAGFPLDQVNKDGDTALMFAAGAGHVEIVQMLLNKGANPNDHREDGSTSLMLAIWNGHRNVVQVLLQESFIIELNAANKDGDTALRIACIDGRREIIALLLEAEVNVNKISADGYTALITAAKHDQGEAVEMLLEYNAKLNYQAKDGHSAMSVAIEFGCMKAIRAMLKYPINLGMKTQDGFTHLMNAARFGWDEIILELIQAGADVNAQTANGTTALSLAMKFEYDEVVKLLLQANANIYQVDENGRTYLHQTHISFKYIKWLLQRDPYLSRIKDYLGKRPFQMISKTTTEKNKLQQRHVLSLLSKALTASIDIRSLHIHLIGDAYAGKTVTRKCLEDLIPSMKLSSAIPEVPTVAMMDEEDEITSPESAFLQTVEALPHRTKDNSFASMMRGSRRSKKSYSTRIKEDRTKGLESSSLFTLPSSASSKASMKMNYVIHDYGGQEELLVNHANYLIRDPSLYIIVLPLYNVTENRRYRTEELVAKYQYWLSYLYSIMPKEENCSIPSDTSSSDTRSQDRKEGGSSPNQSQRTGSTSASTTRNTTSMTTISGIPLITILNTFSSYSSYNPADITSIQKTLIQHAKSTYSILDVEDHMTTLPVEFQCYFDFVHFTPSMIALDVSMNVETNQLLSKIQSTLPFYAEHLPPRVFHQANNDMSVMKYSALTSYIVDQLDELERQQALPLIVSITNFEQDVITSLVMQYLQESSLDVLFNAMQEDYQQYVQDLLIRIVMKTLKSTHRIALFNSTSSPFRSLRPNPDVAMASTTTVASMMMSNQNMLFYDSMQVKVITNPTYFTNRIVGQVLFHFVDLHHHTSDIPQALQAINSIQWQSYVLSEEDIFDILSSSEASLHAMVLLQQSQISLIDVLEELNLIIPYPSRLSNASEHAQTQTTVTNPSTDGIGIRKYWFVGLIKQPMQAKEYDLTLRQPYLKRIMTRTFELPNGKYQLIPGYLMRLFVFIFHLIFTKKQSNSTTPTSSTCSPLQVASSSPNHLEIVELHFWSNGMILEVINTSTKLRKFAMIAPLLTKKNKEKSDGFRLIFGSNEDIPSYEDEVLQDYYQIREFIQRQMWGVQLHEYCYLLPSLPLASNSQEDHGGKEEGSNIEQGEEVEIRAVEEYLFTLHDIQSRLPYLQAYFGFPNLTAEGNTNTGSADPPHARLQHQMLYLSKYLIDGDIQSYEMLQIISNIQTLSQLIEECTRYALISNLIPLQASASNHRLSTFLLQSIRMFHYVQSYQSSNHDSSMVNQYYAISMFEFEQMIEKILQTARGGTASSADVSQRLLTNPNQSIKWYPTTALTVQDIIEKNHQQQLYDFPLVFMIRDITNRKVFNPFIHLESLHANTNTTAATATHQQQDAKHRRGSSTPTPQQTVAQGSGGINKVFKGYIDKRIGKQFQIQFVCQGCGNVPSHNMNQASNKKKRNPRKPSNQDVKAEGYHVQVLHHWSARYLLMFRHVINILQEEVTTLSTQHDNHVDSLKNSLHDMIKSLASEFTHELAIPEEDIEVMLQQACNLQDNIPSTTSTNAPITPGVKNPQQSQYQNHHYYKIPSWFMESMREFIRYALQDNSLRQSGLVQVKHPNGECAWLCSAETNAVSATAPSNQQHNSDAESLCTKQFLETGKLMFRFVCE